MKLIIADDERAVRESILKLIDWNSLDIKPVGLCADGIEAYHMILDESPDIVITDIEMPGLTGLELVQKISQTDLDTQFIILSGYGEFNYARKAMKYGVRHYLLKPCNEEQIISCINEAQNDFYHKRTFHNIQEKQKLISDSLLNNIIYSIISEGINGEIMQKLDFEPYEQFIDMTGTGYQLFSIKTSDMFDMLECFTAIYEYIHINASGIPLYGMYVKGLMFVFFQDFRQEYNDFECYINNLKYAGKTIIIECVRTPFKKLAELLQDLIKLVKQYETIYYINDLKQIPICNYQNIISHTEDLTEKILDCGINSHQGNMVKLGILLRGVSNTDFLKQLAVNLLVKISTRIPTCSPIVIADFLINLNKQTEHNVIIDMLIKKITEIFIQLDNTNNNFVHKLQVYVTENLSNPNLTLKWIAKNYLYMNVDYVSRKFAQETGCKFSNYITNLRIQKAKILLASCNNEKLQNVAEQVGCGDNYQYFSQIFKKHTGMTPSAFAKQWN